MMTMMDDDDDYEDDDDLTRCAEGTVRHLGG